jgi:hypothetical protein
MTRKFWLLTALLTSAALNTGCCRWCDRWCGNNNPPPAYYPAPTACVPACAPAPVACPAGCAPVASGFARPGY